MLNKFLVAGRLTADPEIKTIGENRLCKFTIACLVGSVHNNRYEKDGQKRSSIEVKVEEIHFSGGKKKQENTTPTDNGNDNPYAGTPNDPLF